MGIPYDTAYENLPKYISQKPQLQDRGVFSEKSACGKPTKNCYEFGEKAAKTKKKNEARFELDSVFPRNPYNNLSFDHINGSDFFLIFWF